MNPTQLSSLENWPENWSKTAGNKTKNCQVTLYMLALSDFSVINYFTFDFIILDMILFLFSDMQRTSRVSCFPWQFFTKHWRCHSKWHWNFSFQRRLYFHESSGIERTTKIFGRKHSSIPRWSNKYHGTKFECCQDENVWWFWRPFCSQHYCFKGKVY